jgi:two-component system OmpR family response regulator
LVHGLPFGRAVSVLLVHHEGVEAAILAKALDSAGFRVHLVSDARERLDAMTFDVVVVGVSGELPGRLALCTRLRVDGYKGAIVALSKDSTELDRLVDAGADDFAAVPIEASELVARVRMALRRVATHAARWGPIEIDRFQRVARLRSRALALTAREYALLACLVEAAGTAVSRTELVAKVWGRYDPGSNMVEVHLSRLRAKLGEDADIIQTIRRAGYRLRR